MPLRRILLTLLVLTVAMSAAAAISNRETTRAPTVTAVPPPPSQVLKTITASLPRDRVVRARLGDRIELTVATREPDTVEVAGYDLLAAADPDTPARFDFVAERPGRFEVKLQASGETLGRLEVADRP